MQLGIGRLLGQLPHRAAQSPPWARCQRRQHCGCRLVRIEGGHRRVRRSDQLLEEVDVPRRVELRVQLLPERIDLQLENMEKRRGRPQVTRRQRLGPIAKPLQQHLAVPHRTQCHPKPAELRTQRISPLRFEQRTKCA